MQTILFLIKKKSANAFRNNVIIILKKVKSFPNLENVIRISTIILSFNICLFDFTDAVYHARIFS